LTDVGANEFVIADAIRLERLGALHAASVAEPGSTGVAGLMETDVSQVLDAAVGYWSSTDGAAAARLGETQVVIADLPATLLGLASAWTQTVWLDADAAGFGWQVEAESRERRAESQEPADGRYDLLSVLAHELGHVLGYEDMEDGRVVMGARLMPGVQRWAETEEDLLDLLVHDRARESDLLHDDFFADLGADAA
jgi:hypothetical protein